MRKGFEMDSVGIRKASRWSIDFGNVLVQNIPREHRQEIHSICQRMRGDRDTEELDNFLITPSTLVPGAIAGLRRLVELNGSGNLFIVSRASGIERFVNCRLWIIHR